MGFILTSNTSGNYNTGVGDGTLEANTTGQLVLVKKHVATNTTASYNTAVGAFALDANSIASNTL